MPRNTLTIGALAEQAGVSVRTLQYYDRVGLLRAATSEGGRRLYTPRDVAKLQQILFLKSFGLSLQEIAESVSDRQSSEDLLAVFGRQRELLERQVANLNRMIGGLETAIADLRLGQELSLERLVAIMELTRQGLPYAFVAGYFDDRQYRGIAERFADSPAAERFLPRAMESFARLEALHRAGADPEGPEGQELAAQWWELVQEFAKPDPSLLGSMIRAGMDVDRWPEAPGHAREAIRDFLGAALQRYLRDRGIQLGPDGELDHD
jgi:DNA-binding transcriptional MerR regulator